MAGTTATYDNEGVRVRDVPTCYVCGTSGVPQYTRLRDGLYSAPGTWTLLHCPRCGLVWLDPRPLPDDIGKLYGEYFTHSSGDGDTQRSTGVRGMFLRSVLAAGFGYDHLIDGRVSRTTGRLLSRVLPLRDLIGGTVLWLNGAHRGRLLDVGCGAGRFLAHMRSLGWTVAGFEPDDKAAQVARDCFDLKVYSGTLDAVEASGACFDVVTMSHVIEHVADPVGLLRSCWAMLRPGGQLVIVTPNSESLGRRVFGRDWALWDPPRHLMILSRATLQHCAERAGFRVREIRTTSNMARHIWHFSRHIRHTDRSRSSRIRVGPHAWRFPWYTRLAGLAFWAAEDLLRWTRHCGEELVLIATRESRGAC